MSLGYTQSLYLLPFDHRGSFQTGPFGWKGPLTEAQTRQVTAAKQVVYAGFEAAVVGGLPKERAAILLDEQFGSEILHDAVRHGYAIAVPAERSGQDEFELEYGEDFAAHIEAVDPTFCKVLVRYNGGGDAALNARQAARLQRFSEYLRRRGRKFMFELLVPPTPTQLDRVNGDRTAYDHRIRPALMTQVIRELQNNGVEPDVWKVEGLYDREDCAAIVESARRDGRRDVSCIVLGRGASGEQVADWLRTAATDPGFIGFAVGRTTFWHALVAWRDNRMTKDAAAAEIAAKYRRWVDVFEAARRAPSAPSGESRAR
jgi:5-dehydro-2-deoxygluconokinase